MKIGNETVCRGARALVYDVDKKYAYVELLENTPAEGNDFAKMVLRAPRDGLGQSGSRGDCFRVTL